MSHEVRGPVTVILGVQEQLAETVLDAEQGELVEVLNQSGTMLLELLNNLLDLSKTEAGALVLEKIPFDLLELVEDLGTCLALKSQKKGLELVCHVAPEVPRHVVGDPVRLRQILMNLVGNAIKFTEQGEVVLRVQKEAAGASGAALRFSISDTGVGIPVDSLEDVFKPFAQLDPSISRKFGGTGLGLTITRQLVELLGGKIEVESRVNQGTTFWFVVEVAVQADAPELPAAPSNLDGAAVLVLDDTPSSSKALGETLDSWGASSTEIHRGSEALERFVQTPRHGGDYRWILLSSRIAGVDGFQTAERLKESLGTLERVLMVLPSNHRADDLARIEALGMRGYLIKPITRARLQAALDDSPHPS
jgi:CheY-like chemotaxis protein